MLYAPSAPYSLPRPDRFSNSEARPPSSPPSMSSIRQLVLLDITAVFMPFGRWNTSSWNHWYHMGLYDPYTMKWARYLCEKSHNERQKLSRMTGQPAQKQLAHVPLIRWRLGRDFVRHEKHRQAMRASVFQVRFHLRQEPITRSLHLPYIFESTFARIFLFLEQFSPQASLTTITLFAPTLHEI